MLNNSALFIFDSEHIDDIHSRLYGFAATKDGMFTSLEGLGEDLWDATGAWVSVKRTDERIEITQDSMGCFGLFLFREGDYWALSNSFNHLLDFLKGEHKLSLNNDYADAYLSATFHVNVYGETIVNEIAWLDRRAQVSIDPQNAQLSIHLRPLDEQTVEVDSEEGIRLLDAWHDKWASFVAKASREWPGPIYVDVSGGFDTRLVLAPILSSGVDYSRITFDSHHSKPHYEEDFRISTQLAEEFGFRLNEKVDEVAYHRFPPIGSFNERALSTIFFEKSIYTQPNSRGELAKLTFRGFGGEMLRHTTNNRMYEDELRASTRAIEQKKKELPDSPQLKTLERIKAIMQRSFEGIDATYKQTDPNYTGSLTIERAMAEAGNRAHFGMSVARTALSHNYSPTPLFDPLLLKLHCNHRKEHPMLIVALILTRYHEKLAQIPFDKKKHIPEETLRYAQELNERFPRTSADTPYIDKDSLSHPWIGVAPDDEVTFDMEPPMGEQLAQALESPVVGYYFTKLYGPNAYAWTIPTAERRHSTANKYAAVAIAKVADDIQNGKKTPPDFGVFVKACCATAQQFKAAPNTAEKD